MSQQKRALVSVSDKTGLVEFGQKLEALEFEILSTGGTARTLREAGIQVTDVSDYTGFPEMMDGRVKTLHPKVHGGLLYLRDNPEHQNAAQQHNISTIDMVVVNLYPFEATIAREGVTTEEAIEQIDIGGPSMVRSAAKNHRFVTIVCDPAYYGQVAEELDANNGETSLELKKHLAAIAFDHTAKYDRMIADYLKSKLTDSSESESEALAPKIKVEAPLALEMRYGENPHQKAGYYGNLEEYFKKLHGKDLSYNNLIDLAAAVELIEEFDQDKQAALAIIKHTNPCGIALGSSVSQAWTRALSTDQDSANGGIVAINKEVNLEAAETFHGFFTEIIAAPSFTDDALELLTKKKNRRLIQTVKPLRADDSLRFKSAPGGLLVQEADSIRPNPEDFKVVTERQPSEEELHGLLFAWRVVKHVKSNAIVFTSSTQSLGIGAGQMSRVDSARIAMLKAKNADLDLKDSLVASDAFFPFADGLLVCADAGAKAVIQPGGSVRDEEVIQAANERGIAMIFTGKRHFRH